MYSDIFLFASLVVLGKDAVDACCLVTSYEPNGDLKSYLIRQRDEYMNTIGLSDAVPDSLDIAQQIVTGAAYLDELSDVRSNFTIN